MPFVRLPEGASVYGTGEHRLVLVPMESLRRALEAEPTYTTAKAANAWAWREALLLARILRRSEERRLSFLGPAHVATVAQGLFEALAIKHPAAAEDCASAVARIQREAYGR